MATITAPAARPPVRTLTVPGSGRVVVRRSAKDPVSGVRAYLVKSSASHSEACNISVSLKRKDRYIGTVLKGHKASIVDMEFLPTPPDSPIFTLGTCDQDGVVFLWFLRVARDALGIDYGIKQLRKYSFYSLRKSHMAYYNRIRLSGTPENGTMVLVPNDGSSVRVIAFSCEPLEENDALKIEGPPPVQQIEAPKPSTTVEEKSGAPVPPAPEPPSAAADDGESAPENKRPLSEGKQTENLIATPQPLSQDDFNRELASMDNEDQLARNNPLNETFPRPGQAQDKYVDDDIAEAAARGAGITDDGANPPTSSGGAPNMFQDPRPYSEATEASGVYEEKYEYDDAVGNTVTPGRK